MKKTIIFLVISIGVIGSLFTFYKALKASSLKEETFDDKLSYYANNKVDCCYSLTEEEQNELLEAFNVIIPENEKEAFIYSFGVASFYSDSNGKSKQYEYYIEIDGVNDYFAFYERNSHRVGDNGLLGRSKNENCHMNGNYEPTKEGEKYLLTYDEPVWLRNGSPYNDEENAVFQKFDSLFRKMKESRMVAEESDETE